MFNDRDNEFDNNKLTNLDSVTVNTNPISDNEVSKEKYGDDSVGEGTIVRFNKTLENYLKASVGNDTYNLTKNDRIHITDTTNIKYPNIGGYLLQNWIMKCNDKNINGKIQNFEKSTKTSSPTGYSRATHLPSISKSSMCTEAPSSNHGKNVFVSFERTDFIQISEITSYYNSFSILTNDSLKSMGRFRIQLLFEDNTWSLRYNKAKKDQYSDISTQWRNLGLSFSEEIYGIKLIYDETDTPHADMCFSNITITHSVH